MSFLDKVKLTQKEFDEFYEIDKEIVEEQPKETKIDIKEDTVLTESEQKFDDALEEAWNTTLEEETKS